MKVALYCRVSTALQFEKGNSIPEQKKRLSAFCESKGWDNYDFFVDPGFSGSNLDRPALQDLIRKINEYDMVLVYKLDRLSRNQRELLYLIDDVFLKNGVDFNSMTENFDTSTPVGRLMLSMMGAFAELERQQINERMMMGRIASASKGKWRGGSGVPTGYKYIPVKQGGDGNLTISEDSEKVKEIFNLFESGYTYNAIKNKFGFATGDVVKKILTNPVYIGKIKYAGEVYEGNHEPIISKEQFERVQGQVARRTTNIDSPTKHYTHLLSGFVSCSCGSKVCWHGFTKNGHKYQYYECYTRLARKGMRKSDKPCRNKIWRADDLEETIWNVLEELEYEEVATESKKTDTKAFEKELAKVDKQIAKLIELYSVEDIPLDVVQTQLNDLKSKRNILSEQILALQKIEPKMSEYDVNKMIKTIDKVKAADLETQRAFIGQLIESITLLPGHDLKIKWKF